MKNAIFNGKVNIDNIHYINAHKISTPLGDEIELGAVAKLFKSNFIFLCSTKFLGHLLGAAGAVEAIFSILAVYNNVLPPTLNLTNPCVDISLI